MKLHRARLVATTVTFALALAGLLPQSVTAVTPVRQAAVPSGMLFAGSDSEEFGGTFPPDQLAVIDVQGSAVNSVTIETTTFQLNGLEATGRGTLFSGDPFSSDQREISFGGDLLNTVSTPLPPTCCNEDLAFDGTHVWRAHFPDTLFRYNPDGSPVTSYAQPDVVGAAFVGSTLWVTHWAAQQVGTFDPATNTFTPMFSTPSAAGGLAYDASNNLLWVGLGGGSVQAYDLSTLTPVGSPIQPFGPIPNTIDGLAFVSTPGADLQVTKTDSPDPVKWRRKLTYTVTVSNHGPSDATEAVLKDTLPGGMRFISVTPTQGSCSRAGRSITCVLGTLAGAGSTMVTIVVKPRRCGFKTNVVSVAAAQSDPDPTNNQASVVTRVIKCRDDDDARATA